MIFSLSKSIYSCDWWEQKALMPGITYFHPIVLYTQIHPVLRLLHALVSYLQTYPFDVTLRCILLLGAHTSVLDVLLYDSNIFIFIQKQSKNENLIIFMVEGPTMVIIWPHIPTFSMAACLAPCSQEIWHPQGKQVRLWARWTILRDIFVIFLEESNPCCPCI